MDTTTLERLIDQYETEALRTRPRQGRLAELCSQVEGEAERIGYTNHRRLAAVHTLAEQALLPAGERDRSFAWL